MEHSRNNRLTHAFRSSNYWVPGIEEPVELEIGRKANHLSHMWVHGSGAAGPLAGQLRSLVSRCMFCTAQPMATKSSHSGTCPAQARPVPETHDVFGLFRPHCQPGERVHKLEGRTKRIAELLTCSPCIYHKAPRNGFAMTWRLIGRLKDVVDMGIIYPSRPKQSSGAWRWPIAR